MIKLTLPKFNNTQKPVKIGRNCPRNERLIVFKKRHNFSGDMLIFMEVVLMEEILHHLECANLANSGINYLSSGARFL